MSALIALIPTKFIYWVAGILLSAAVSTVVLAAKFVLTQVGEAKGQISGISSELTLQRTNCLSTLQRQGEKQIVILERIAESVSYLKGRAD